MAWTAPRTWVAGETVTAALMNTHVRDNLKAIGDAWGSWSPSWTATTTNPAIGNGTLTGGYIAAGKYITFWVQIVMGSTTTYGTGAWQLNLPVTESAHRWVFQGAARDSSPVATYPIVAERTGSGVLSLRAWPTTAGNGFASVSSSVPFTWANTDELFISGTYEAA